MKTKIRLLALAVLSLTLLNSCGVSEKSGSEMSYSNHLKSSDNSKDYPCSDYTKIKR